MYLDARLRTSGMTEKTRNFVNIIVRRFDMLFIIQSDINYTG